MEEKTRDDQNPKRSRITCFPYKSFRIICFRVWVYFSSYRNLLLALLGGQIISLLLCGTGVTSQALQYFYKISIPTTQLFLTYFVLACVFFPTLAVRKNFLNILKDNWWRYLILGVIDVEANFLVVLAYKYTTLTSIQLLDSLTIVFVLVLSFIFLKTRYLIVHIMGVSMCIIGIISLVLADLTGSRNIPGTNLVLGDLLCVAGSLLYAISNVAQEYLVKNHSITEWLGFIGIVGSFVSGIQLCIVERHSLALVTWSWNNVLTLVGFIICLVIFYTMVPFVMRLSSAAVVNLSLLTADIFTLIFGIFLFKFKFTLLYILAFIIIIAGIFIFNLKSPPTALPRTKSKKNLRNKLAHTKQRNTETTTACLSKAIQIPEENHGLVRGPAEAVLSSNSYTTYYSQSMSYSYGSNSKEGPKILQLNNHNHH